MRPLYRVPLATRRRARHRGSWFIAPAVWLLGSCGGGTTEPVLVTPCMRAIMTGAISDSFAGTPALQPYSAVIAHYSFQIEARSGRDFLQIWGEPSTSGRPPVGTYLLTEWQTGIPERRMHATLWRDDPGGVAQYYSVSGTLTITASSTAGVVGTFDFDGVAGYILPDRAVLSPNLPHTNVRGTFSVLPDPSARGCSG